MKKNKIFLALSIFLIFLLLLSGIFVLHKATSGGKKAINDASYITLSDTQAEKALQPLQKEQRKLSSGSPKTKHLYLIAGERPAYSDLHLIGGSR